MTIDKKGYQRVYQNNRYRERKKKIKILLGGRCSICRITVGLEIHHKDQAQKLFNPGSSGRKWSDILQEIQKCELLCEDCHKARHATTHGMLRMYQIHSCRCNLCKAAWLPFKKKVDKNYHEGIKSQPEKLARRQAQNRVNQARYRANARRSAVLAMSESNLQ